MVKAAGQYCNIKLDTKIVSLDIMKDGGNIVAVTENGEQIVANNAVIAGGHWTNAVLEKSKLPKLNLDVRQVQRAHYEVDQDVAFSIPQEFHFHKESYIDGGLYYVFPSSATVSVSEDDNKAFVKVGVDLPSGKPLDSMDSFCYNGSEEVLSLMDEWVKEHLPAVGKRVDSYCQTYTMTADSYFVMDKVTSNVVVFSDGSGRAFKFGPLLGDCMVSLLTGEEAPVDLKPFSIQRDEIKV